MAHRRSGRSYFAKGEYDKAIADYTEAIRLDPKSPKAYYNRAAAYDRKGRSKRQSPISTRQSHSTQNRPGIMRCGPR